MYICVDEIGMMFLIIEGLTCSCIVLQAPASGNVDKRSPAHILAAYMLMPSRIRLHHPLIELQE